MRPAERRSWVGWATAGYRISEVRACRVSGFARSTIRYRSRRSAQEVLRRRLREIASVRISYGYRRLHVTLRREGWPVNHKRAYRLYSEERLGLRRRKPGRRRSFVARQRAPVANGPRQRWAMDFMHDELSGGQKIRVMTVIDVFARECMA